MKKEYETVVVQPKQTHNGVRFSEELVKVEFVGTELVRCKDCKHFQYAIRSNGWGECDLGVFGRHFVEEEWYCSMGEREGEVEK